MGLRKFSNDEHLIRQLLKVLGEDPTERVWSKRPDGYWQHSKR